VVIVISLVAGLLAYAAFPPIGLWWCAPMSLALLIYLLSNRRLRQRTIAVITFGIAFFGPLLAWSNTYVGDVPWLILTVLQVVLLVPLALLHVSNTKSLFVFPFLWVGVEFLRAHFPFHGFGWGRIAFSQADAPYVQIARIGGAPLLSFIVAFIAVFIYLAFQQRFALSVLILASIIAVTFAAVITRPSLSKRDFSFIAVQGGVPSLGLDFNSRATQVFENHIQTTVNYLISHMSKPQVVLWPENSIDVDPFKDPIVRDQLQSVVDEFNIPFIVGAVLQHGSNFQNASILWETKKGPTTIYIKRHLTPFGEYIPLRPIAEIVSPYAKDVVDFVPGDRIVIHVVGKARFAPVICFELLDDASGRAIAKQSNAFVVQTNSATFGLSPESDQQLGITRIRSIEHQRYSISISTSGVSALIDPEGKLTHRTGQNQAAVIDSSIGLINSVSIADRYGSPIEAILILFPLFPLTLNWLGRRRVPQ
jgi:apolipoprotein N-acyltransferase